MGSPARGQSPASGSLPRQSESDMNLIDPAYQAPTAGAVPPHMASQPPPGVMKSESYTQAAGQAGGLQQQDNKPPHTTQAQEQFR